jgi:hypothetical protein
VQSVICLLDEQHLVYYRDLHDDGLLGLYRSCGLEVFPLPLPDPAHARGPEQERRLALLEACYPKATQAYERLPKAVLVQCSAGSDRSPRVARGIAKRLGLTS